ncbi:MAG: hypothetical protein EBZ48_16170 [Proteobacteria bacterium]|nr:hypothetical protein [Pseudomonadota bacterium]
MCGGSGTVAWVRISRASFFTALAVSGHGKERGTVPLVSLRSPSYMTYRLWGVSDLLLRHLTTSARFLIITASFLVTTTFTDNPMIFPLHATSPAPESSCTLQRDCLLTRPA